MASATHKSNSSIHSSQNDTDAIQHTVKRRKIEPRGQSHTHTQQQPQTQSTSLIYAPNSTPHPHATQPVTIYNRTQPSPSSCGAPPSKRPTQSSNPETPTAHFSILLLETNNQPPNYTTNSPDMITNTAKDTTTDNSTYMT